MQNQTTDTRQEWISAHTSMTLCIGLITLVFFSLAAILPLLKIGSALH
jgi:hypothetical protein